MEILIGLFTSAVVIALMCIWVYKYAKHYTDLTHFICPFCGTKFKLSKAEFIVSFKTGIPNERIVTCPRCGYKGRMPIIKDD